MHVRAIRPVWERRSFTFVYRHDYHQSIYNDCEESILRKNLHKEMDHSDGRILLAVFLRLSAADAVSRVGKVRLRQEARNVLNPSRRARPEQQDCTFHHRLSHSVHHHHHLLLENLLDCAQVGETNASAREVAI